jgi:hypothetical protein
MLRKNLSFVGSMLVAITLIASLPQWSRAQVVISSPNTVVGIGQPAVWGPQPVVWGPQPVVWGPQPVVWGPQPVVWGPQPVVYRRAGWGGTNVWVGPRRTVVAPRFYGRRW